MAVELAALRGRLAHASTEQAEWEQSSAMQAQLQETEAMSELRRLRKLKPEAAARYAAARHAGAPNRAALK